MSLYTQILTKSKHTFFLFSLLLTQTSSSYLHQSGMKVYRAFVSSIWSSSFLKCVASDSSFHSFQFVTQYVRGQAFHKSYESLSSSLFAPHHLISHSYVSIFIEKFYSWIYKSVFFQWISFLVFLSFTCTRKFTNLCVTRKASFLLKIFKVIGYSGKIKYIDV